MRKRILLADLSFVMDHAGIPDGKTALLLVDIQKKFAESTAGLREGWARTRDTVNTAANWFRSEGLPVVYLTYSGPMHEGPPVPEGDSFAEGLVLPLPRDPVIPKNGMNAFCGSALDEVLHGMDCESVVITGMVSHCCVLATYFGAIDRGYSAFILKGGISATDPENTAAVERICRTVSVDDLPFSRIVI